MSFFFKSFLVTLVAAFPTAAMAQTDPTISNVTDKNTLESTATTAIAITVGDAETPAVDLLVTATSSDTVLLPAAGITLAGSGAARTVVLTPAAGLSGTVTITLSVTDADSQTATDTFLLTINPVYTLPGETIPDLVIEADGQITVNYQIADAAWVSSVGRSNTTLFKTVGTSASSALRLQPTSGGTLRSLRIKPDDRSTSAGLYGTSTITLTLAGSGAPIIPPFLVTVNPRAVADNQLLGIPGSTSTFDVLENDVVPLAGHSFAITAVTTPTHGSVEISATGSLVRYTPTGGYLGPDTFNYTVSISSADSFNGNTFTGIAYVTVGNFIVVDSPTASQHTDIDINYGDGVWTQNIQTDAVIPGSVQSGTFSPTVLDSDEGVLFFDPSCKIPRPANGVSNFDFMGVAAGADIWQGPDSSSGNRLYLGFSSENTPSSSVVAYETGDPRAPGNAGWVETQLVAFSGPGHFSGYDFSGSIRVYFDTADGLNSPTDTTAGGNATDTFFGFAGSHAHLNWVFTQPGRYSLTFRSRTKTAAGFVTSPDTTFYCDIDTISNNDRPGENPPLLANDTATLAEDSGPLVINTLANDSSSPDLSELLTITGKTNGTHGTVTHTASGLTYTPAANFSGNDSFTYTVTDEHGGVATATVSVTVSGVNDSPIFAGMNISTIKGSPVDILLAEILAASSDAEGNPITVAGVTATTIQGGTVTLGATAITYTPASSFTGVDTITFTLSDGIGTSDHTIPVTVSEDPLFTNSANGPTITPLAGGAQRISFYGISGRTYGIQRSTTMANGSWTQIGIIPAQPNSPATFDDPSPPQPAAFYRIAYPAQ